MAAPQADPIGNGLAPETVAAMRSVFTAALAGRGLDGRALFDRLAAGQTLLQAMSLPAGTTELVYARAYIWFSLGRPEKAEPLFQALCLLDPGHADGWVGLGLCLRMRQAVPLAEACFATAARLRPGWPVPLFHALELLMRLQEHERARLVLAALEAGPLQDLPVALRRDVARFATILAA